MRASLGGDGDVDLQGDSIAEDFYSVLGLVTSCSLETFFDLNLGS